MSDRPTVTVEVDGESREVQLPDGYLPESQVREEYMPKSAFKSELDRRVKSLTAGKRDPDELLEDEDFLGRVVETRRDWLQEQLGVEGNGGGPDPEKIRAQVLEREVNPLKERLSAQEKKIQKLRNQQLRAEVIEAAHEIGVVDDLVPLVERYLRDEVAYSEEHDGWFVVDEWDGDEPVFEYSAKVEKGQAPFKTPAELLSEIERSGDKKSWFKARTREGVGYKGRSGRGTVSLEEFQKMGSTERRKLKDNNPELWKQLMDQRREAGESKLYASGL